MEERFLLDAVKMEKLYRSCVREAACGCRLTPNETAVLLYLRRHAPQHDTATDIAQMQGISKALVARSVDSLYRRGFVRGARDLTDRRIVHLQLCGDGVKVAQQLYECGCRVAVRLRGGISEQEMQLVQQVMDKMQHNLDKLLQEMEGQVTKHV